MQPMKPTEKKYMPNDHFNLLKDIPANGISGFLAAVVMSIWAGSVNYISSLNGKKFKIIDWLLTTITCCFVGIVTGLICKYFKLDPYLSLSVVSVFAYRGTQALETLWQIIKKNVSVLK